jgi:hypothetical protein
MDAPVKIVGVLGANPHIHRFCFVAGREDDAVELLLSELSKGAEVSLANDSDPEGEGATSFRSVEGELTSRDGGHGWQGGWRSLTREEARALIRSLCDHNRGGDESGEGQLTSARA